MCYPILYKELKNAYIYIYNNGLNIWFLIHQQRRKKMLLKDYLKERKKK